MPNIPSYVAPAVKTWLGIAREAPGATGTPVLPTATIPLDKSNYQPEDTPHWLPDESLRGSMAMVYAEVLGVEDSTFTYGGPVFGDVYGYFFDNVFGDLSTTGSSPTSSTTLNGATLVNATSCTLTSAAGYSIGNSVQIDTGTVAEVVVLTNVASNTITFAGNPLRFAHANGVTVAKVTGPYTHVFALLQSGAAQPPTHTATDFTSLTTTVGARSYPSLCIGQVDITGNAEQLLDTKVTGSAWISAPAASTPTNSTQFTVPVPNWRSTVTVGGTQINSIGEWSVSIKRQLQVYFTAQGAQNPYIIARGSLDAAGVLSYTVPSDESPLLNMLNNTQPTVAITISNGLAGTALISLTLNINQAAFVKAKPTRTAVLVGYEDEWQAVANSTNAGGSGGLGPMTLTLVNNVATY
jgi:hypothetical protein